MTRDVQRAIEAVQTLRVLPESERTEYYDSVIEPLITRITSLIDEDTDLEHLTEWLYLQSSTLDLAVEGITEVTYDLNQRYPEEVERAVSLLPTAQQTRIQLLLGELAGQESAPPEILERESAITAERIEHFRDFLDNEPRANGFLGEFAGSDTLQSSRGFPVVHGTFTLFNRDGGEIGAYTVNSGGGSQSYRTRNGPLPPGLYRVSNHRPNRTTTGMVLNGIGYSLTLTRQRVPRSLDGAYFGSTQTEAALEPMGAWTSARQPNACANVRTILSNCCGAAHSKYW